MDPSLSVAQSLLSVLESEELKKICFSNGIKYQLDELKRTVSTIIRVLPDAQAKGDPTACDLLYQINDQIDHLFAVDHEGHFSILKTWRIALKSQILKNKLDIIARHSGIKFSKFDPESSMVRTIPVEASSYVADLIGRDADVEHIVGMLLNSNVQQGVSFVHIVGMAGLGKTALAKRVYDDARISSAFQLRMWIWVSDFEQRGIRASLGEILDSATGLNHEDLSLDDLRNRLQEQLAQNKFLLVLDGVYDYSDEWIYMKNLLTRGQSGSRVVLTSRIKMVPEVKEGSALYELRGLSEEHSWRLFTIMAFGTEQANAPHDLVRIGLEIAKRCGGIPLAITMVGSLLYGQDKAMWLPFLLCREHHYPYKLLILCFDLLESSLKTCLIYCTLFPRNYVVEKQDIVNRWMAMGYIVPNSAKQTIEDAGEDYVKILLRRGFFQDKRQDEFGEIASFKMHDHIHDLSLAAAREKTCRKYSVSKYIDRKVRHLSLIRSKYRTHLLSNTHICSVRVGVLDQGSITDPYHLDASISKCNLLRALELNISGINILPDSIGSLPHLRYLNLSYNSDLEVLPQKITKLHNLQCLYLRWCHKLKELPKDFSQLVKLRVLDMKGCSSLTHMPRNMGQLTNLHMLTEFVLGHASSSLEDWFCQLEELKALQNLRHLAIRIQCPKDTAFLRKDVQREAAYMKNKECLYRLLLSFSDDEAEGSVNYTEKLLEDLRPNINLKSLHICGYHVMRMPDWIISLPNLVSLHLENCRKLQYLPNFESPCHLKVLHLVSLLEMEYVFEGSPTSAACSDTSISALAGAGVSCTERLSFLTSLEVYLCNMPKLKGWSNSGGALVVVEDHLLDSRNTMQLDSLGCLSRLKSLIISGCPELKYTQPSSQGEELTASFAEMSLTKTLSGPETQKTHDSGVTESELDASLASSSLSPHEHPLVIVEDAAHVDTRSPTFNGMIMNDALLCCAVFPPDYEFEKDTLLQLWLANGLFHEEPMEKLAGQFFEDCKTNGYFQVSRAISLTGEVRYKFKGDNQLLMSQGSNIVRMDGSSSFNDVSLEVRHLSIKYRSSEDSDGFCGFKRFKQLRTLIFLQGHESSLKQVPRDLFLSLKQLRVLDLSHSCLSELPSSVGNMTFLHYLDLSKTPIKHLPEAIDFLENLQTLKLRDCLNLSSLPRGMRKLAKLRHLDFNVLRHLSSMPEGMGALTNIRTLSTFLVGVEEGSSIRQLKNLNNLSGSFCIFGLENVLTEDDALEACLHDKVYLRKLELQWSNSQDEDVICTKVLSCLQPNADLEELCISCFSGAELPSWISETTFSKLASITLFRCDKCAVLPSLGQLPLLKSLYIVGLHNVKVIDHNFYGGFGIQGYVAFPMLEKMTIRDMSSLEEWIYIENSHCPRLLDLTVKYCPIMCSLSILSFLCSLKDLEIIQCRMLASCLDGALPASLQTFIIEDCPLITANILEDGGKDWCKVAHVPHLWIDHQQMHHRSSEDEVDDVEI